MGPPPLVLLGAVRRFDALLDEADGSTTRTLRRWGLTVAAATAGDGILVNRPAAAAAGQVRQDWPRGTSSPPTVGQESGALQVTAGRPRTPPLVGDKSPLRRVSTLLESTLSRMQGKTRGTVLRDCCGGWAAPNLARAAAQKGHRLVEAVSASSERPFQKTWPANPRPPQPPVSFDGRRNKEKHLCDAS